MQAEKKNIFTVGQVNEYIKYLIESSPVLDSLYVRGELSNVTAYHASGHIYFSLKDETGVLRSVMFRSNASRLKFRPENGMRVLVHGRISTYPRDGQYQLYADAMEPDGIGALALAYEQLKEKLAAEGLFAPDRKKPIPPYPETVGVITSPTGAAVRDIIQILGRRAPSVRIVLFPTLVQGENAPRQLCSGIRFFNTRRTVDVIIIGRGGGSLEELWAFNDETLARTVAASEIPVISAVGHETDFTICDLVSDLRAPTPSAAAELAVPDRMELKARLQTYGDTMTSCIRTRLTAERQHLSLLASKRVLSSPDSFLVERRLALEALTARIAASADRKLLSARNTADARRMALDRAMESRLTDARTHFLTNAAKLRMLDPLSVLTRGYAAVFDDAQVPLRSISDLTPGDTVHIRLADGTAHAAVTAVSHAPKGSDNENTKGEIPPHA